MVVISLMHRLIIRPPHTITSIYYQYLELYFLDPCKLNPICNAHAIKGSNCLCCIINVSQILTLQTTLAAHTQSQTHTHSINDS